MTESDTSSSEEPIPSVPSRPIFTKNTSPKEWELPHETPDYAGGKGFKVPQAADALEAARVIPEYIPPEPTKEQPHTERAAQNSFVRPLRTFKDDVAVTIQKKNTSVAELANENSKKKYIQASSKRLLNKRNTSISFAFTLLLVGCLILGSIYLLTKIRINPPKEVVSSIIAVDKITEITISNLSATEASNKLHSEANAMRLPIGDIAELVIKQTAALDVVGLDASRQNTTQFFESIGAEPPRPLVRGLEPLFMFGIHADVEKNRPFLLFKISSFEQVFSQMFMWEERLATDLAPVLGITNLPTGTSLSMTDTVIENRDTRALKGANGELVIFYTFLNQKTLLVATDTQTLEEVFFRLTSLRTER